jgi:maltose/moltooligosaccharide transporter
MASNTIASTVKGPAVKPRLTTLQIFNMSFGFLGIQFGFALQNSNASGIFGTMVQMLNTFPGSGLQHLWLV